MKIKDFREKIDAVDTELVSLLNRRAAYAAEIGKLKKEKNIPVHIPKREEYILERIRSENPGPLPVDTIVKIFKDIISVCKDLE